MTDSHDISSSRTPPVTPRGQVPNLPARRSLSDNELAIMTILWRDGQCTGRHIAEQFPHKVAYTTILTYLKRLEGKGYVSTVKAGRAHQFSAEIPRDEVVNDLLARALYALDDGFDGLLHFAIKWHKMPAALEESMEDMLADYEGTRSNHHENAN